MFDKLCIELFIIVKVIIIGVISLFVKLCICSYVVIGYWLLKVNYFGDF